MKNSTESLPMIFLDKFGFVKLPCDMTGACGFRVSEGYRLWTINFTYAA